MIHFNKISEISTGTSKAFDVPLNGKNSELIFTNDDKNKTYVVKQGDTLYQISRNTGISVENLKKYNNLSDNNISPGQELKLSPSNDIPMVREVSDTEITRQKYINQVPQDGSFREHVIKNNENFSTIAKKYGIEINYLLAVNNSSTNDDKLSIGEKIKIPPTRTLSIKPKNLDDVAKTMGVTKDFISKLKLAEDGINPNTKKPYKENEFRNDPYPDEGNYSVGIGHLITSSKEHRHYSNAEVLELFAKDLLKKEENLWAVLGKSTYEKLPQPIKEALLDMTFNKGTDILNKDLIYRIKNGKYEAAINMMTNNKTMAGIERSGLSKRRLLDISTACKIYNGKIPNSNIATAQNVYNRGIELLKAECKSSGLKFENIVISYNDDVKSYFGDNIIKTVTK